MTTPHAHSVHVEVVRVFTTAEGELGNELGIVQLDEASAGHEQQIAKELGFSETVFLSAIADDEATMRIFAPDRELPFAGHPSVGTAWWLAERGHHIAALVVPAGRVAVRYDGDTVWITGRGEWAPPFEFRRVDSPADVEAIEPGDFLSGEHYLYAWTDESEGAIRSRAFVAALGIPEDQATGAAAIGLSALLERDLRIVQGAGCLLDTRVLGDGFIEVGGRTVFDRTITLNLP